MNDADERGGSSEPESTNPPKDDPPRDELSPRSDPVDNPEDTGTSVPEVTTVDEVTALEVTSQEGAIDTADASAQPRRRRIYFNPDLLPHSYPAYVAWLDVMGSRSAMSQSLMRSAQYIGRLHVAILMNRKRPRLQVSPFMDGAYIRADYQRNMLDFLWGVFEELAYDFLTAREHRHRFMPRCGLSFGHIIQGTEISTNVSIILGAFSNKIYREGIYLGFPMVQAFMSESSASPFGVAIHESARSFCQEGDRPLSGLWWRWHLYKRVEFLDDFLKVLMSYFDWCANHTNSLGYAKDRIAVHRQMASEYFDVS